MLLTFQDQYGLWQENTGDYSAAGLVSAKRDINEGGTLFLNRLGRKVNREYEKTNLKEGQQNYQFRMGILRSSEFTFLNGTEYLPAQLISSEAEWNQINITQMTGGQVMYYYIRGSREVSVYPVPSADVTNGIKMSAEPQHIMLSQADFTDGTITVANGDATITHSASGFSESMVGRWLQVTDGSDSRFYRVASFSSVSSMELENYYEGISGSGRSFRIGEVMKIPPGYCRAPVYWALHLHFDDKEDDRRADRYEKKFERLVRDARQTYGASTSRLGVKTKNNKRKLSWIDLTPPIQYP